MIVVDTNVLAYLLIQGPHTAAAEQLLQHDNHWTAPALWRSELRNILAGYLRRGSMTFEHACSLQEEAEHLMDGAAYELPSRDVLELVRTTDCSAYDCEFAALALSLNVPLYTMDRQLLRAFPRLARPLADATA